ncbi:hypothetical protein [Methylobacterium sp.]|uniref:hypothetical protein n=1 Tax=Methylobacterium sp. TaxID=409 RepID=UPI0025FED595|nr:hypothetical protein [Methylobacterium sp.]MBY0256120.1 hypothetical protein [Methylobacterium sp.]
MATQEHTPLHLFEMLCWDRNSPDEEWRQGFDYGSVVARHEIPDRSELLRLVAAADRGRLDFLEEISRTDFIGSSPAANAPLTFIEDLLFGANAGGFHGDFGRAFCAAFRLAAHLRRLH